MPTHRTVVPCFVLFWVAFAASAHHSGAAIDMQRTVTLTGSVKQFVWTNPHVWVFFDVTDNSGAVTEWSVEGAPVMGMVQRGMRKTDLKAGDKVEISFNPRKDGKPSGGLLSIKMLDTGKFFGTGPQFPPGPPGGVAPAAAPTNTAPR